MIDIKKLCLISDCDSFSVGGEICCEYSIQLEIAISFLWFKKRHYLKIVSFYDYDKAVEFMEYFRKSNFKLVCGFVDRKDWSFVESCDYEFKESR